MSVTIKFRRGTSAEWTSNGSTILASGEPGYELDTGRFKIGNGVSAWSGLSYASVVPSGFLAGSGVSINLGSNGVSATISVSGLNSTYISDFNEAVDDRIGSGLFVAGTGINLSYIDGSNSFTVSVTGLINNANDNRILTSRDSTTTGIDAETNLTFDGSLLSVSGNVVTSGHFGINTGSTPYPRIFGVSEYIHIGDGINDPVYISTSDGNATFANSKFTIGGDGNLYASSGNFTADATGSGYFASDLSVGGNLFVNNIPVSVSGHSHTSSDITDFNSSVSGLLPVKNIVGGTGIYVTSTTGNYTIGISGNVLISGFNADLLDSQHGSYYLDWTNTTNKPSPIITGILTGDVAGTGSVTLSQLSNGTLTINSTIQPNSVALGTDTTGNYVSLVAVSGTGLSISGSAGEGSTFTVVSNATPANSGGAIISRDSNGNFYATTGNLDVLYFNTNIDPTLLQGQMAWNDTAGTADIALTDTAIINVGEHEMFRVRNETGGVLYKGQAVIASGVHANGIIEPSLYTANGSVREVRFMGLVYENINDNNNGYVIHFGHVNNIDTRGNVASNIAVGDETWVDGDILYVHPTVAGKLTKNEPKHSISVAIILDAASNGKMFVRPISYGHLNDNHDVSVSGATNGQFLQYNSATDYWVPSSSGNFSTLLVNGTGVSVSGHTHTASQITDFNEAVDDRIGSGLFAAGTGINLNYNDAGNSFTVSVTGLVNNPTNNRILTSRDSTTTGIDAESDLTFENKTLNIGSSGNAGTEAIINLYTNDGGDGKPSINFKDYDDNTKLKLYWDDDDNTSYVYSLNDSLVLSGPTNNYIGINSDGTINIVSSGVTSNNNFSIINQTASTIASFDTNKNVVSLSTGTYPSLTELSYVKGVTSAIQTQLNAKQNTLTNPVTGTGVANHIAYWNSSSGIVADSGQLYWDSTNNRLGIGTITPASDLQVVGTGRFTNIDINNSAIAGTSALTVNGSISTQNQSVIAGQFGMYGDGNTVLHKPDVSTFAMSVSNSGYKHSFGWNNLGNHVSWAVINRTGVGIGTSSPSYPLHVIGTGNFSQNLLVNGTGVSISGHTHTSSDITNFNSSVSGLLPTIANSGDNRILTSTGTTTGINGESNLTFDGTNLVISSGLTASTGNFTVSITGTRLDIDNIRIDSNTISSTNTNGNIIISPIGNGALQVSSGGNSRGTNAIDLQKERLGIDSAVAGGQYSNILGGYSNVISNNSTSSSILGGIYNSIFGNNSATIGNSNSLAGPYSLNFGNSNICFKSSNLAIGAYNRVSAPNSTAIGNYNFIGAPSGYIEYYVLSVDSNIIYLDGSYSSAFASGTPITIYGYYNRDFVNYTVNSVSENSDNTITALVVNSGVSPLYSDGDYVTKNNTSSIGSFSTAIGFYASCTHQGELAFANGSFGDPGDAQHSTLIAKITTTTNTANTVLTLDGASVVSTNRLTIQPRTAWTFNIKLSAYNTTDNQSGWWIFRGGIRRNAANSTVLVGSIITENGVESSLSTASASVVADDTNEALEIRVTGVSGKNIRWVAVVELTQCGIFE